MEFVFQGNPDNFDIDTCLASNSFIYWRVPQLSHEMRIGDQIVIWRSGSLAGAIALGRITELPNERRNVKHPEALDNDIWVASQEGPSTIQAGVSIDEVRLSIKDGMVTREVCKNDSVFIIF